MRKKVICLLLAAGMLVPAAASASEHFPGELHTNGTLNAFDLAMMKKRLADDTAPSNADLDNDGALTQSDIAQMQDYLLGRIDYFDGQLSADSVKLTSAQAGTAENGTPTADTFQAAQMHFAAELLRNTAQNEENTLVSPLSVMLALSMTANGANTQTLSEMEAVLGDGMSISDLNEYLTYYIRKLDSSDTCKLYIADSIWYRDDEKLEIYDDFLNVNTNYYDAQIYKAPFNDQTVKDVNLWVKRNTDGMIPKIVDELTPENMMMLINTIAFDAEWQEKYEDFQIYDGTFTAADGTKQTVEMMGSDEHLYYDFGNATGFGKDYTGGYRFVAILPEEGMTVSEWIAQMDSSAVLETLEHPEYLTVVTEMPKFSYDTSLRLNDALQYMGMPSAFSPTAADFTKMGLYDNEYSLHISKVLHKTHITVDNAGTRAAAVTSVMMDGATAVAPEYLRYVTLDRPFVYMIVDTNANLPIFIGTVQSVE